MICKCISENKWFELGANTSNLIEFELDRDYNYSITKDKFWGKTYHVKTDDNVISMGEHHFALSFRNIDEYEN